MSSRVVASATADSLFPTVLALDTFRGIIEGIETAVVIADRSGRVLLMNGAAKMALGIHENLNDRTLNIFQSFLQTDGQDILSELATGRAWAEREIVMDGSHKLARV